jgi:hypothetical protein
MQKLDRYSPLNERQFTSLLDSYKVRLLWHGHDFVNRYELHFVSPSLDFQQE